MTPTILCIDDDEGITRMLQDALGGYGFRVLVASSVDAALEIARTTKLDLMILDIFLPQEDGFTLFDQLAAEHLQTKVPIIMASGFGTEEARNRATRRGAVAFLQKPFQIHQLMTLVRWAAPSPDPVVIAPEPVHP